jgi:hypothetical protein
MKRSSKWAVFASALLSLGAAFVTGRTFAEGIPTTGALTYSGHLETADGAPLTGTRNIEVKFWGAASGGTSPLCTSNSRPVVLERGRFGVNLPDDCTGAVGANADVWIEVLVDGSSLGRTKAGAVPYAVEAAHASEADFAGSADTLGPLAASDVQPLVTGTCPAGQSIRTVFADGSVECEADDDTTYTAGLGVTINGPDVSADSVYLQRRIRSCDPNNTNRAIRSVAQDGTASCIATVTGVSPVAGSGLSTTAADSSGVVTVGVSGFTNAHLSTGAVRRAELQGTEIEVYQQAAGCGGGLTTSPTCTTLACAHHGSVDILTFKQCDGSCDAGAAAPCSNGSPIGWLIDDAMPE